MTKAIVLIMCVGVLLTSCASEIVPVQAVAADVPTAGAMPIEQLPAAGAMDADKSQIEIEPRCMKVIAEDALHLRNGASESDLVLTWLLNGDVVHLVDATNAKWTRVRYHEFEGYARASYLIDSACAEIGE